MEIANVFSSPSETISILVYTQSFLCDYGAYQYFKNADRLESIKVYFMPLLITPDKSPAINTGIYKHTPEGNSIRTSVVFSDCSGYAYFSPNTPQRKTDEELSKIAEEIMLRNPFHPLSFDYTVASDVWCYEHKGYDNVKSFSEVKEILRLFLVNKKEFELVEHYYIDESFYYIYRNRVIFKEFHNFWSSTVNDRNETNTDTANALGNRLILLSMCIDNTKTEAYKPQNNTTAMHLKYHISYLLLLITGIFDSIAWIINNLYGLGLEEKNRRQIDLINCSFRKKSKLQSAKIYTLLSKTEYVNRIEAIRELRDTIVHRNFINTISSGEGKSRQNYLWIDKTSSEKLLKAGFDEEGYFMRDDLLNLIYILRFVDFLQETVTNIVNDYLMNISNEIYHSSVQIPLHILYKFPSEPYVL